MYISEVFVLCVFILFGNEIYRSSYVNTVNRHQILFSICKNHKIFNIASQNPKIIKIFKKKKLIKKDWEEICQIVVDDCL